MVRDAIARRRRHVLVLDLKGTLKWSGFNVVKQFKKLTGSKEACLCYRPTYDETQDAGIQARLWEWIYRRQHTTVYVDETAAITQGDLFPYYYGGCLMRGRELGIELWSATQRPLRIPQVVLSESEHVYAFRLRLPQDRKRVGDLTNIPEGRIQELPKQHFLYAPQDGDISGPLKLNL